MKIRRDWVVYTIIVLGFIGLIIRAFHVQIISTDFLQKEADKRQVRAITIPAPRGEIYDRDGRLLALSTPMAAVWIDPKVIVKHEQSYHEFLKLMSMSDGELNRIAKENRHKKLSFIYQFDDSVIADKIAELDLPGIYIKRIGISYASNGKRINVEKVTPSVWVDTQVLNRYRYTPDRLAEILGQTRAEIARKIYQNSQRRFVYLKRGLVPEVADEMSKLRLTGVYTQGEYKRYYPAGESIANLLGFTNIDDGGIEGIELAYNNWLKGEPGKKQVVKDRAGHVIDFVKDIKAAKAGNPMVLSIDQNLQYFTYRALKKAMIEHQAKDASSIILDAKTGEILAMVSLPGFNPNASSQRQGEGLKNRVITDLIEPGSTMKPFIVAKALDESILELNSVINTHPGYMTVQGNRINDTKNNGKMTPLEIIQKSSNVGVGKIALMLTPEQQRGFWADIGIGQESGLFLPGENSGLLKPFQQWRDIDQVSASFGYGFNTNLLGLAHAYLAFANDGKMVPLSLIKIEQPENVTRVLSKQTTQDVLEMMETVVAKGGTAPKAQIPGYRVAGKTGTVHKTTVKGGYEENTYMALFAGIVPVSNPDMVMITAVNEPSRGIYYGGSVAAPVFKEVMQEALRLRNVAPDAKVNP